MSRVLKLDIQLHDGGFPVLESGRLSPAAVDLIRCIYDAEITSMEKLGARAEQLLHAQSPLGLLFAVKSLVYLHETRTWCG